MGRPGGEAAAFHTPGNPDATVPRALRPTRAPRTLALAGLLLGCGGEGWTLTEKHFISGLG